MAHWVGLTNFSDPSKRFWVNLDNVAVISPGVSRGSSVVIANGTEYAVADTPEDILSGVWAKQNA